MIIVCPHCGILYGVDQSLLVDDARTVRCSNCAWEWLHTRDAALPDTDETLRLLTLSISGRQSSGHKAGQEPSSDLKAASPAASPPPQRAEDGARVPEGDPSETRTTHEEPHDAHQAPIPEDGVTGEPPQTPLEDEEIESERDDVTDRDYHADAKPDIVAPPVYLRAVDPEDVEAAPPPPAGEETGDVVIPPLEDSEDRSSEAPSARARARLRRPAIMAAAAIAASLLISIGLLAATRGAVTAAFPGAAHLYSAIGLSNTQDFADGLEIRDVSSTRSWNDGEQILTVAGDLANTANKPRVLPMVRVVLVDGSDVEVQEVVIVPPGDTLPVGESVRFEAQINDPADTAARIKVSLAPRPKSS